jgi:hypothetical protein
VLESFGVAKDGIEIPPAELGLAHEEAGGMVPVLRFTEKLRDVAQAYKRNLLPTTAVLGFMRETAQHSLHDRIDSIPANIKDWSDPPHVELANCSFDSPEDLQRFVEMYGFGLNMVVDPRLPFHSPRAIAIKLERLREDQAFLRRGWGKPEDQSLKEAFAWSLDDISFVNGRPRITVRDISDYILLLFMNDSSADRLRVCINPGCKTLKYFVKQRRNQKFCSVRCKNAFHVNTWLATPANRRRWNEYRRVGSQER